MYFFTYAFLAVSPSEGSLIFTGRLLHRASYNGDFMKYKLLRKADKLEKNKIGNYGVCITIINGKFVRSVDRQNKLVLDW